MVKKRKMTAPERDRVMSKLIGQSDADPNWHKHFSKSDVVIEAVFEDLALKHKIIQVMARRGRCKGLRPRGMQLCDVRSCRPSNPS
jgi:3-hydroxyacyl-CoA dehydrogenase